MQLSGLQPVMEEVIFLRHHCLQMWSNCMVSWCKKKNRHFQKMKCFERNEWGRESPLMETSNVNSQRESRVGDKNQFHKVWSFHQEGPPNADLTDDQSKSLYIYSAWQCAKAFFFTHSITHIPDMSSFVLTASFMNNLIERMPGIFKS